MTSIPGNADKGAAGRSRPGKDAQGLVGGERNSLWKNLKKIDKTVLE
jgi:hypothetical protein